MINSQNDFIIQPTSFPKHLCHPVDSRDGGSAWTHSMLLPLTKTDLAMSAAECPVCQQWNTIVSPHPQVTDKINSISSITERTVLLFPEIHIMNINLPALYAIRVLKLPFVNLQNASLSIMVLHTCSFLSKERTV